MGGYREGNLEEVVLWALRGGQHSDGYLSAVENAVWGEAHVLPLATP